MSDPYEFVRKFFAYVACSDADAVTDIPYRGKLIALVEEHDRQVRDDMSVVELAARLTSKSPRAAQLLGVKLEKI